MNVSVPVTRRLPVVYRVLPETFTLPVPAWRLMGLLPWEELSWRLPPLKIRMFPLPEAFPEERVRPPRVAPKVKAFPVSAVSLTLLALLYVSVPVPATTVKAPVPVWMAIRLFLAEVSSCRVPADRRYKTPLLLALLVESWIPPREADSAMALTTSFCAVMVSVPTFSTKAPVPVRIWVVVLLVLVDRVRVPVAMRSNVPAVVDEVASRKVLASIKIWSAAESWRSLLPEVAFSRAALPVLTIREKGPLILVSASKFMLSLNSVKSRESAVILLPDKVLQDKSPEPLVVRTPLAL